MARRFSIWTLLIAFVVFVTGYWVILDLVFFVILRRRPSSTLLACVALFVAVGSVGSG